MIGARYLEDEEIDRMLARGFTGQWKRRNKALFAVGISCGFRCKELLALTMRDVMHRRHPKDYITAKRQTVKKKSQGYTNKVQQFAKKPLKEWIDQRIYINESARDGDLDLPALLDEPFMLTRSRRQRKRRTMEGSDLDNKALTVRQVNNILDQAFDRCDITGPVSSHSMRKTFAKKKYVDAVRKFRSGESHIEPLRIVQKALGHKDINATLSYLSFMGLETDPSLFDFNPY